MSRDHPILAMEGITKRFGPVVANDGVSFAVRKGTVHALLGENGAGKTTLMSILYGMCRPDEGRILLRGTPVKFDAPRDAIRHGIGMIHQQFMLIPPLTVAENIVLGLRAQRGIVLDLRQVEREVADLSEAYGLKVDPRLPVWQLPVGTQQRVEILKALYRGADLLVLDEPTSVLTPGETRALFIILRRLVQEGHSVVFISHKLEEVLGVSDEVTVMRAGRVVNTLPTRQATPGGLARMMVGRDVVLRLSKTPPHHQGPVLEVHRLSTLNDRGLPALREATFVVRGGEIVGVAGVDGNGQSELVESIAGLRPALTGQIRLNGQDITGRSPQEIIGLGTAYIPADRNRVGLVLDFSVAENLILKHFRRPPFCVRSILQPKSIAEHAEALVRQFDIRAASTHQALRHLSGGNQQKVALAREVSGRPALIIAAQPTRGLDVGAAEFVMRTILEQRDRGSAILYVSTELEEVLTMSDRVAVMFGGEIVGIVDPATTPMEEISLMMAGARRASGGEHGIRRAEA
jgi:general nucleoside transport system ATP-binding protein